MDAAMERQTHAAIAAIDAALGEAADVSHTRIQGATNGVIALRDRAIGEFREGRLPREVLDRVNALASLAFGAEFPLSGLHMRRLAQTRDGLRELLD